MAIEEKTWIEILDEFDEYLNSKDASIHKMGILMLGSSLPIKLIDNIEELGTLHCSVISKIGYNFSNPQPYYYDRDYLVGKIYQRIHNQKQAILKQERIRKRNEQRIRECQ